MSSVTFTCEDGSPLSHMAAADFAEQHGRICARGSGYSGYRLQQQLQREFKALETVVAELSQALRDLKLGRPLHLEEQRLHREALRRDIVLRARDLVSLEGQQPAGSSFYRFSAKLSDAFLQERNLTEGAINTIHQTLFSEPEAVAQHTYMPPEDLHHGLEGVTSIFGNDEQELRRMTVLYNYVMRRLQEQQQQQHHVHHA